MTQAMASGPDCISAITTLFHRFEAYARDNTAAYLRRSGVLKAEEGCARDPSEPVTVFHTREYIAMPLVDLAFIMQRGINCNMETLLVALIIMCRFSHYAKVPVTRHMVHRLYVACLHVAMKTHCDAFYANSAFAQRAGVSLPEMNRLEVYVLNGIQWRATVMLDTSSVDEGLAPTSPIAAARHQTLQAQQHQQRVAASSSFAPAPLAYGDVAGPLPARRRRSGDGSDHHCALQQGKQANSAIGLATARAVKPSRQVPPRGVDIHR
jgi:hypothetical protein